ncbi:MAG: EF-hand domain-containing protein [Pirellulaceae bacterium]|nr:EF-hand domain-containing protein [Pirellulaceae bacterium]
MKKYAFRLSLLAILSASTALAQPPGPPNRPGDRGGPGDGPRDGFRPPPNPVMEALDANHDQIISADEIQAATKSLLTLDKNGDGKLSFEECQPAFPRPGDFRPGEQGPGAGRPGADRGPGADRAPGADRGPRDGERPSGPPDNSRRPGGPGGPDGPPRDQDSASRPGGPGFQGPNPERFVAMAMEFDADKDGKLNRDELMKFAQEMPNRRPGGDAGGDRGPGRPDGGRPDGGRPDAGRPDAGRPDAGRPDRPARPE